MQTLLGQRIEALKCKQLAKETRSHTSIDNKTLEHLVWVGQQERLQEEAQQRLSKLRRQRAAKEEELRKRAAEHDARTADLLARRETHDNNVRKAQAELFLHEAHVRDAFYNSQVANARQQLATSRVIRALGSPSAAQPHPPPSSAPVSWLLGSQVACQTITPEQISDVVQLVRASTLPTTRPQASATHFRDPSQPPSSPLARLDLSRTKTQRVAEGRSQARQSKFAASSNRHVY